MNPTTGSNTLFLGGGFPCDSGTGRASALATEFRLVLDFRANARANAVGYSRRPRRICP
ncbi:hypothetical protein ABZ746_00595 [Streptomyces sp. NPDC020096]